MTSPAQKYRWGKTGYMYMVFAGFGLTMSLGGPSIPDLCEAMNISNGEIAIAFSVASVMWTVGAIVLGPIIDRFQGYVDLYLGTSLIVVALCTFIKPFSPKLWVYVTASAIEALFYAGIDLSCNVMTFSVWGEQASSPVQGLHAAWGIGFAVGPLLIRPFLGPDRSDEDGAWNSTNLTTSDPLITWDTMTTSVPELQESRIEIAYIITGCLMLCLALAAFIIYIVGVPKDVILHLKAKESFRSVFSVKAIANGDLKFASIILILFGLFYFGNAGRENVFNTWLFNYAIESDLDFSKQEAALLDAAAKFSFMGGRILAAFLALKVPIQAMLMFEVYIVLGCVVCLGLLGTQTKTYLWVFSCLTNAFSAPIWPGGLAWTDRYIIVSGVAFTVMNIGAGASGLFFNYLTGWLFSNKDANTVMYVLFFCAALMCVLIVIMQIVASKHGGRYGPEVMAIEPEVKAIGQEVNGIEQKSETVADEGILAKEKIMDNGKPPERSADMTDGTNNAERNQNRDANDKKNSSRNYHDSMSMSEMGVSTNSTETRDIEKGREYINNEKNSGSSESMNNKVHPTTDSGDRVKTGFTNDGADFEEGEYTRL